MTAPPLRVIRIWKYRGWCAICRVCNKSITINSWSQPEALGFAETHWKTEH